eukprot:scaffold191540_cov28-Attheya_sp.AAC.1
MRDKQVNNSIAKVQAQKKRYVLHGWAGWELPNGKTRVLRLVVDSRESLDAKPSLANFKVFF